jgi:hypothetical protein
MMGNTFASLPIMFEARRKQSQQVTCIIIYRTTPGTSISGFHASFRLKLKLTF